ncbi:hypothetical protein T484DRAFT_1756778, partial [Baffinella frigidus]
MCRGNPIFVGYDAQPVVPRGALLQFITNAEDDTDDDMPGLEQVPEEQPFTAEDNMFISLLIRFQRTPTLQGVNFRGRPLLFLAPWQRRALDWIDPVLLTSTLLRVQREDERLARLFLTASPSEIARPVLLTSPLLRVQRENERIARRWLTANPSDTGRL